MKLYTSYFSNPIKLPENNTLCLAITAYPPTWWNGLVYDKVAPPKELLLYYKNAKYRGEETREELEGNYIDFYTKKVLLSNKASDIYNELFEIAARCNKDNVVLLCFEKSSDFCHRHILRAWFNYYGIECNELS